jgi:hypothetical protein
VLAALVLGGFPSGSRCHALELSPVGSPTVLDALTGCGRARAGAAPLTDEDRACFAAAAERLQLALQEEACADAKGVGRSQDDLTTFDEVGDAAVALSGWLEGAATSTLTRAGYWAGLTSRVQGLRDRVAAYHAEAHGEVVLVSQGGVSLGSWQSGFVYGLVKHMQASPGYRSRPLFPTISGASAGSINGLLAASASCERPEVSAEPEQSLFFQLWVNLGLFGRHGAAGLFDPKLQERLYILSPAALSQAVHTATTALSDGPRYRRQRCGVDLAFPVTHLGDSAFVIHQGRDGEADVVAPRLTEHFVVHLDANSVQGVQARNLRPPVRDDDPFLPPRDDLAELYPLLGHGHASASGPAPIPLTELAHAVRASGAFPLAFPPVTLALTRVGADGALHRERGVFIDGGFLDNTPLGLAVTVDEWKRTTLPTGSALLRDLVPEPPKAVLLVDPNVEAWDPGQPVGSTGTSSAAGVIGAYGKFLGNFAGASLSARLVEAAERYPYLRRTYSGRFEPSLVVPRRHMPIAGAELQHFLAFFERDYRVYDFFVGLADATELVAKSPAFAHLPKQLALQDPRYRCMRAYFEERLARGADALTPADLPAACAPEALGSAMADLDAAVERLVAHQDGPEPAEDPPELLEAERAVSAHNFRAMVAAMHNYRAWLVAHEATAPDEARFNQFFDALEAAGFRHVDLANETHQASIDGDSARALTRELMGNRFERLAAAQPSVLTRAGLGVGLRTAANLYAPRQPRAILGVGFTTRSGFELAGGWRPFSVPLRLDLGLRVFELGRRTLSELGAGSGAWFFQTSLAPRVSVIWPSEVAGLLDVEWGVNAPFTLVQGFDAARPAGLEGALGGGAALVLADHIYVELRGERALWRARLRSDLDPVPERTLFGPKGTVVFGAGVRAVW